VVRTRLPALVAGLALVLAVFAPVATAQERPPAEVDVTFSKPLIVAFPSVPTGAAQLSALDALPARALPAAALATQDCPPAPTVPTSPNVPAATAGPSGPPPSALMLVLLTNHSDQLQSYMVTATRTSSGALLGQGVAAWVRPGKSAIPTFVLMDTPPPPDDVTFTAALFDFPGDPCNTAPQTAQLDLGAPSLDGMTVSVPVTNADQTAYQATIQAGLLQGDQLVAVAMGSTAVPAGGTATASLPITYPFGLQEAPASDSIVPALFTFALHVAS